jgi:hypothetical protein
MAAGTTSFAQEYPDDPDWNMWQFINEKTPPDSRILAAAFYTSRGASSFGGFWVDRPFYVTDSHLQTFIRLDEWSSFVRSLSNAGVTHVLIYATQANPNRHGFSFVAERNEYSFCRRLATEQGQKMAQFGDLQLYRVWPDRTLTVTHASDPGFTGSTP